MKTDSVIINSCEEKQAKNGVKFFAFNTNKGYMNCFDEGVSAELAIKTGQTVSIEFEEKGGYKNIKGISKQSSAPQAPVVAPHNRESTSTDPAVILTIMANVNTLYPFIDMADYEKHCIDLLQVFKNLSRL